MLPETLSIIDLSTDYRLDSDTHEFVYGLPELNKDAIRLAQYVANRAASATAIQWPLRWCTGLLERMSTSTPSPDLLALATTDDTSHFSWRNNNISIYKAFQHQHLAEIRQSILQLQGL